MQKFAFALIGVCSMRAGDACCCSGSYGFTVSRKFYDHVESTYVSMHLEVAQCGLLGDRSN